MLGAAAAILLCLLPTQVNGLTALATCLSGFQWMFSSIGQSPCDVAVELASVCAARTYQLGPIGPGWHYTGPWVGYDNSCLCSSVYYSLSSACAHCQGAEFLRWSSYNRNCTMIHLGVYPQQIPVGVRVPAYAYLDVSIYDQFSPSAAYDLGPGVESSRSLPPTPTPTSTATASNTSSSGATTVTANAPAHTSSPAMIGGVVVGGLVGLGLIAALIIFLVLRSKQKSRSQNSNLAPLNLHTTGNVSNQPSDMSESHGPYYDPNLSFTGNSTNYVSPTLTTKQNTGGYSGIPEV